MIKVMKKNALIIKFEDNVATVIADLAAGETAMAIVEEQDQEFTVIDPIPFGHKFAVKDIHQGEDILKYGSVIGRATSDIKVGEHVHVHNVESLRGRGDLAKGEM